MSPYNILSDIKSGRIQVKSMDSATILFFKCRRWDYTTFSPPAHPFLCSKALYDKLVFIQHAAC